MSTSLLVAESVWEAIESAQTVTEDQLSILHFIFGRHLEKAAKIVDSNGVKRISGKPSGRSIFKVVGESRRKEQYLCFPEHYCSCYSFFYDVVNRGEHHCCKHQLAARLASSTGKFSDAVVSDEVLATLL
ncbi:hypothetical protein M569_03649, partial [Genlisea aurea]